MINRQKLITILSTAENHLQKWLDLDLCECEGGHSCGRDKVEEDVAKISDATASLKASKPVAWAGFADNGNIRIWCADPIQAETLRSKYGSDLEPLFAHPAPDVSGLAEVPLGAIENGKVFAERLENYDFECEAGSLLNCCDWQEFRRCFEHLADWASALDTAPPAAQDVRGLAEALDHLVSACELPGDHCEIEQALPAAVAALDAYRESQP